MKLFLTIIVVLGLAAATQAQAKMKNPRLRIEAGTVFSTYGSSSSISNDFFPSKYLNKPFIQAKFAVKLNRKLEFNLGISKSSTVGTTERISENEVNNYYGRNYKFDLNYTMISIGFKKFYGKAVSPIGKYFEAGIVISKQQASSFNYMNPDGIASVYQIYAANRPSAHFAFGKRNMITKKLYFFREFGFCVNGYTLDYKNVNNVNKRTFFYANSFTNFNFLMGVGVVI